MKFPIINQSNDENYWGGWTFQRLYDRETQPSLDAAREALNQVKTSAEPDAWTGMHRGSNHDVREATALEAIEASLSIAGSAWSDIVSIRLTPTSIIVDFTEIFKSFYVQPVGTANIQVLPLT